MEAAVIATYRCTHRCRMCLTWQHPSRPEEEFKPSLLEKLPALAFCNLTGGEPFLREDIDDIVSVLKRKARRVVVSTNGYLTDRIVALALRHRRTGFRISLEGLSKTNDELRGVPGSFDNGQAMTLVDGLVGVRAEFSGIMLSATAVIPVLTNRDEQNDEGDRAISARLGATYSF